MVVPRPLLAVPTADLKSGEEQLDGELVPRLLLPGTVPSKSPSKPVPGPCPLPGTPSLLLRVLGLPVPGYHPLLTLRRHPGPQGASGTQSRGRRHKAVCARHRDPGPPGGPGERCRAAGGSRADSGLLQMSPLSCLCIQLPPRCPSDPLEPVPPNLLTLEAAPPVTGGHLIKMG